MLNPLTLTPLAGLSVFGLVGPGRGGPEVVVGK